MKASPLLRRFRRLLPLALFLALASCATRQDVTDAVTSTNAASLMAELNPGSASPQSGGAPARWQAASQKVEAFIAANPDQKVTNAELRVRQAVMLMQNRQPNLAKAAFDQVALADLPTARDRALKRLQEELLWWYRSAGETAGIDFTKGEKAQAAITTVLADLKTPDDESIRDFLAAVRASIGVKMATDVFGQPKAQAYLKDAIDTYAAGLPAGETSRWVALTNWPPAGETFDTAVSAETRRHFRADGLIAVAKKAMTANGIHGVTFKDAYFQKKLGS
jgi:hypothetical protein